MLTPGRIWLIDVLDYDGLIFGGNRTDEWTQVVRRHSYRFRNPLYALEEKLGLLKPLCDDSLLGATVVFSRNARFPKDLPDGVTPQAQLAERLRETSRVDAATEARVRQCWEALLDALDGRHA